MAIAVYEEFHVSRFFTIMEIRHPRAGPAARGVVQGARRGLSHSGLGLGVPHPPGQAHPCVNPQP